MKRTSGTKASVFAAMMIVACEGAQGPSGPAGPKGERGPVGPPGTVAGSAAPRLYRPRAWISCSTTMDLITVSAGVVGLGQDGVTETFLEYELTVYSNGDVASYCRTSIGSARSGTGGDYYPNVTKGSSTGFCQADGDMPPFLDADRTAGHWEFDVQNKTLGGTYTDDPIHPLNARRFNFAEADCNVNVLDDNLEWMQARLGTILK